MASLASSLIASLIASVIAIAAVAPEARAQGFGQVPINALSLGVVVNTQDPKSVAAANLYMKKRGIPKENLIRVSFDPTKPVLDPKEFERVHAALNQQAGINIQALALTWLTPYRVGCMSITSAFAFGFDESYCASGCKTTKLSPYFNSDSKSPWTDHAIRPTMMLAMPTLSALESLIDRGIAADGSRPSIAKGFVLKTPDQARSVRADLVADHGPIWSLIKPIQMQLVTSGQLEGEEHVMLYFTGSTHVAKIETNRFLPGAIADHLTSTGGVITGSGQMSVLEWLEKGATASFGAVVEPCNFTQKFPNPTTIALRYAQGETLLEAYWKGVAMPGQGLFVGEPLARPFRRD